MYEEFSDFIHEIDNTKINSLLAKYNEIETSIKKLQILQSLVKRNIESWMNKRRYRHYNCPLTKTKINYIDKEYRKINLDKLKVLLNDDQIKRVTDMKIDRELHIFKRPDK